MELDYTFCQTRRMEIEADISDRKVEFVDIEYLSNYVKDFQDLLSDRPLGEKRVIVKSTVDIIEVESDEAIITYSIPGITDKIILDKKGVLLTVRYGGR